MGSSVILSIIHTITIGTILNFNGGNNGHGLKNVTFLMWVFFVTYTGCSVLRWISPGPENYTVRSPKYRGD